MIEYDPLGQRSSCHISFISHAYDSLSYLYVDLKSMINSFLKTSLRIYIFKFLHELCMQIYDIDWLKLRHDPSTQTNSWIALDFLFIVESFTCTWWSQDFNMIQFYILVAGVGITIKANGKCTERWRGR